MKKQKKKATKNSTAGIRAAALGRAIWYSTMAAMWTNSVATARSTSAAGYKTLFGDNKSGKERAAGAAGMVLGTVMGERFSMWAHDQTHKANEAWASVFDGQKRW